MRTKTFRLTAILSTFIWNLSAEIAPPIACNLKALTLEQRQQLKQLEAHVVSAITASRERNDGYAFSVDSKGVADGCRAMARYLAQMLPFLQISD